MKPFKYRLILKNLQIRYNEFEIVNVIIIIVILKYFWKHILQKSNKFIRLNIILKLVNIGMNRNAVKLYDYKR